MEALTWTSSLQVEYDNWPTNLKVQKPPWYIKSRSQGSPRLSRSTCCNIRGPNYLKTDKKRKDLIQNPGRVTPRHVDMSNIKVKYHIGTKGTTNHQLQTDWYLQTTSIDVQNVEIPPTVKDSYAQQRNTNAGHVISLDTLPANVSKENQHSQHKYRWPKAHQIQANKIYDSPDSYPSDVSSSEDSFCLQVKIKQQRDGTQKVPRLTHLITNIAYQLKQHHTRNQYLRARIDTGVEGEFHACQCIQTDISWPWSEEVNSKSIKNRDLYNWHCKDSWSMHNLSSTLRQQEVKRNDLLHCIQWR